MKVGELFSLQRVLDEISEQKVNNVLAYKLARIMKKVQEETQLIEENRKKIIGPYLLLDKDGNPVIENNFYKIKENCNEEVNKKIEEFFATEVDNLELPQLKLEDLKDLEINPKQMEFLMEIITEEKGE